MKGKVVLTSLVVLGLLAGLVISASYAQDASPQAEPLGTALTYQGRLKGEAGPVEGTCDFAFDLYDEAGSGSPPSGGTLLDTLVHNGVVVADGYFTIQLDFGAEAFAGEARWLQVSFDCGGGPETLSPRQELTAAPYALWAADGPFVGAGVNNSITGAYATVGGGENNVASGRHGTVGGGVSNTASGLAANVGGGWLNTASANWATVPGGKGNAAIGENATVGGGSHNQAMADYATVAGGGTIDVNDTTTANRATDIYATVGGGGNNRAGDSDGDPENAQYATVGGGESNTAGRHGTVGGGASNTADGVAATVSGGWLNTASGRWATVPGGAGNTAAGRHSFAAGHHARASADGCFVWGGTTEGEVTCTTVNRTIFRSSGGFYIYTSEDRSTGVFLDPGDESWHPVSGMQAESLQSPDTHALLEELYAENQALREQVEDLATRLAALEALLPAQTGSVGGGAP